MWLIREIKRFNFPFLNLKGEDYLKFLVVSLGLDKIVDI